MSSRAARSTTLRDVRWLAIGALVVVGTWPLAPLAVRAFPALATLGRTLEPWFALQCERDPARTLAWGGVPLAVCARCSGIYFGVGLGALIRLPLPSPPRFRAWVLGAALLMSADVALERVGLHGPWTLLRVVTGLLLAYPLGVGLGARVARAPGRA